jgi:hypothetical protein
MAREPEYTFVHRAPFFGEYPSPRSEANSLKQNAEAASRARATRFSRTHDADGLS